ncbi:MAG: ribbon-helix-helix protein, CopG family [Desulfurococcales archaeon]|nr:ribbon-helix-helix protein, CopG family [Desulfurococcales archaeon]
MRVVSFKADELTIEILENYAREYGKSKSQLIREALSRYIAELSGRNKIYITRRVRVY